MKIVDVLREVYSRKQDVNKFLKSNGLSEESEMSPTEALLVVQNLSDKTKRIKAVEIVIAEINIGLTLADIREKNYKQIAKICHPDSSTGDIQSFQTLQEIKEFFWSFDGKPRKEIKKVDWEHEQKIAQGYEYNFMKDCYVKK